MAVSRQGAARFLFLVVGGKRRSFLKRSHRQGETILSEVVLLTAVPLRHDWPWPRGADSTSATPTVSDRGGAADSSATATRRIPCPAELC